VDRTAPTRRAAAEADLPRIIEIYNATVPSRMVTADLAPVSIESRRDWFLAHGSVTRPLWVTEAGGRVVGWLSLSSFYGRPAYDATVEVSVYVDEASRRRGVGGYLLGEAIRYAPSVGLSTMVGFIFAHNDPSLALFARYGFDRWGVLPRVATLDGIERDLVIVGKRVAG
jgi:phosphinothricin acetyltransferase